MTPVVLARGEMGWPSCLEHLATPPQRLWWAGRSLPSEPAVAIVGSRRATAAGLEIAEELAAGLGRRGVWVISGMARGVDAAAHRGALGAGGPTAAVLGCGIDVCYPPEHHTLRDAIAASGAVLTEEPPGAPPERWRFPRRNRLIAALVAAVVVVEAVERSGALSTARHAADLGREVLAVPGSILSDRSTGTNRLIRDGATPLLEFDDLITAVPALAGRPGSTVAGGRVGVTPALQGVLDLIAHHPVDPAGVGHRAGLGPAELSARLVALELAGAVRRLPGGLIERCG